MPLSLKIVLIMLCGLGLAAGAAAGPLQHRAPFAAGTAAELGDATHPAWKSAPALPFRPAGLEDPALEEGGQVRFLWNEDFLFIFAEMTDSDLVQEAEADGDFLFRSGDVVEIFIRPPGGRCYWELHFAPNGRRSSYFFPSRGRWLASCYVGTPLPGFRVKLGLDGSLNNETGRDRGWRGIAAVPLAELKRKTGDLDFSRPWLVQVSRYNYSAYLERMELSQLGTPVTPNPDFHQFDSWLRLALVR